MEDSPPPRESSILYICEILGTPGDYPEPGGVGRSVGSKLFSISASCLKSQFYREGETEKPSLQDIGWIILHSTCSTGTLKICFITEIQDKKTVLFFKKAC